MVSTAFAAKRMTSPATKKEDKKWMRKKVKFFWHSFQTR
jgi:hypothetical protein